MAENLKAHRRVTTVWLEPEVRAGRNRTKMFFCFNCRVPLIQYTGDAVCVVPGNHPYQPGTILKCKGSFKNENGGWEECGQYYSFVSTVHAKNPKVE